MNTETTTQTIHQPNQDLLAVGAVLSRSGNRFMESFTRLLAVFGISVLLVIALLAAFAASFVPFFLDYTLLEKASLVIIALSVGAALVVLGAWAFSAISALYIKVLASKDVPVLSLIQPSLQKGLGILIIGAVTGLALISGYILFIIPGVVLSCFFLFTHVVYVLENVSWLHAIKASALLVRKEFVKIFTVFLLVILAVMAISFLLSFVEPLGFAFSILVSLFMPAFAYELYVSAKSLHPHVLDEARNEQLIFMWVFAGLSVVIVTAFVALIIYFSSDILNFILIGMTNDMMLGDIELQNIENDAFYGY